MKRKIKVLEKVENCTKDWRHAFLEVGIIEKEELKQYNDSDCIKIKQNQNSYYYNLICGYVAQFEEGGFWFNEEGLHFITRSYSSDEEATYEDAKTYIAERS